VHRPGGPYWGRPEFDPHTRRTMVLDGVGGHRHPRGERWGFLDWDCPGLLHAVHVDGTVNRRDGKDRGWSAEIAVPWTSFALLADGRALPPRDGDVWRIDCLRFEKIGRRGETLNPLRRLDLEPPRALRLAHPGDLSSRDVLDGRRPVRHPRALRQSVSHKDTKFTKKTFLILCVLCRFARKSNALTCAKTPNRQAHPTPASSLPAPPRSRVFPPGPPQKPHQVSPMRPHEFPELPEPDACRRHARPRLDPPPQERAAPRAEPVAPRSAPQKADHFA
jgi:hypothetical protein